MKTTKLGDLEVSRIGLGGMAMTAAYTGGDQDEAESIRTIHRAIDIGVTHIDTAEVYGNFENEKLIGTAIKDRRDEVVIASKFGIVDHVNPDGRINGSPENLRRAIEGSLQRLGVETIDLYYQHRIDRSVPIEETAGAFAELIGEGKIRHYGLSEASAATIRKAHAVHPVAAVQSEYSLWVRDPEAEVLPTLRELGIGLVPFSPLGRGVLAGTLRDLSALADNDSRRRIGLFDESNLQKNLAIVDEVGSIASDAGATAAQVALAWLLSKGEGIAPIPGTKNRSRVEENAAADSLELTADQLARLDALPTASGTRSNDMSLLNG